MKKWSVFIMCFSLFSIMIGGCGKQEKATEIDMSVSEEAKKDIESVSNQPSEEWMDQNQAVKIAQSEFKKDEKESVTNFETPNVEQINFTEEPKIYKYHKIENMAGR